MVIIFLSVLYHIYITVATRMVEAISYNYIAASASVLGTAATADRIFIPLTCTHNDDRLINSTIRHMQTIYTSICRLQKNTSGHRPRNQRPRRAQPISYLEHTLGREFLSRSGIEAEPHRTLRELLSIVRFHLRMISF